MIVRPATARERRMLGRGLVFGIDGPPVGRPEPMAYVGRAACGHIRALAADARPTSVADFIATGVAGLTLERIALRDAKAEGIGECDRCREPEQTEAFP